MGLWKCFHDVTKNCFFNIISYFQTDLSRKNYLHRVIVAYLQLSLLVLWIEVYGFPRNERCGQPTMNRLVLRGLHHFPTNWFRSLIVHRLELLQFEWLKYLRRFSHRHWRHPRNAEHAPGRQKFNDNKHNWLATRFFFLAKIIWKFVWFLLYSFT